MNIWAKLVVIGVTLLFLVLGIAIGLDTWQFRQGSVPATAEIISMRAEYDSIKDRNGFSKDTVSYYPTVRFVDNHGDKYEVEVEQPLSDLTAKVFDKIAIRYFLENPAWVRLDYGLLRDWLFSGLIIATGIIFLVSHSFLLGVKYPKFDEKLT